MRLTAIVLAAALASPSAWAADRSLACTDFYRCVNGAWLKQVRSASGPPSSAPMADETSERVIRCQ
jgi:hypothetical protein